METAQTENPQQIAVLHWYSANQTGSVAIGVIEAYGLAYDGINMWVAEQTKNFVFEYRANDNDKVTYSPA